MSIIKVFYLCCDAKVGKANCAEMIKVETSSAEKARSIALHQHGWSFPSSPDKDHCPSHKIARFT